KTRKRGTFTSPPSSRTRWRSEVERHPRGRSFDCRASDYVVGGIATTNLVAVAARTKTIMRARALIEQGADNVPTGPVVEVVTGADRVLAGGIVEQVSLQCCLGCKDWIVDAQHGRIARTLEGVG